MENKDLEISRVVVYTSKHFVTKRRPYLEDDKISAIWLELGLPRKKKILVCNLYREWQYLDQNYSSSATLQSQTERWNLFIQKWDLALKENKETVVLGDVNLDFLKWQNANYKYKCMTEPLFSNILPQGISQFVTSPRRASPSSELSGLDHIYTNKTRGLRS